MTPSEFKVSSSKFLGGVGQIVYRPSSIVLKPFVASVVISFVDGSTWLHLRLDFKHREFETQSLGWTWVRVLTMKRRERGICL